MNVGFHVDSGDHRGFSVSERVQRALLTGSSCNNVIVVADYGLIKAIILVRLPCAIVLPQHKWHFCLISRETLCGVG